jgi:hypothetical protein
MKTNQDGGGYTAKDPAAAAKQLKENQLMKKGKMNRYDKDMMHERELIYDAKGQLHKADEAYKKGDKSKKQEMIHDRELIYDAKTEIHKEDVAKRHHEHIVNRIAGRNSRM